VFTFEMLSEIMAIAWLCADRPETPENNEPKRLMAYLPS
jgi:hypothetical protein